MEQNRLIAGAMSGTSADGVDIAVTRIKGTGLAMSAELVHHHHRPYDRALKEAIFTLKAAGHGTLREIARIGREVSLAYAAAVKDALAAANVQPSDIAAIAAHGQTLFHDAPLTIQQFDPSLVAYETGLPVVSDFRRADLAAGGQGAPLVPFADYVLFRDPNRDRLLVNIGGIGNTTLLPAAASFDQVVAFDTGPGNCISDHLMRTRYPDAPGFDDAGQLASTGQVHQPLADQFNRDPYFAITSPKSTDGPAMIAIFECAQSQLAPHLSLPDLLATACWVTAHHIARAGASLRHSPEFIVSGGGAKNQTIMNLLRRQTTARLRTMDELGVPADAKEAIAFALLAAATLDGIPSNVPSVTGATRPVVLGSITPRP